MLRKLLVVTFCILSLPMLASISQSNHSDVSGPALVAFAGHSLPGGGYCDCDCPSCHNINTQMSVPSDDKRSDAGTPPPKADSGSSVAILALALLVWLRLRP